MNWTLAFQLATAIIVSLGGGGGIVFGLSNYLGKLWADRAIEKEKHKYAEILQTAKGELDKATNRYQVELDSLSLAHKLRMTEEFSRLGQLWKYMAILSSAFNYTASLGLRIVPADKDEREKFEAMLRSSYENARAEAHKFFLEEKLFIPKAIADCAETTLMEAIRECNFYSLFHEHHDPGVRREYRDNGPKCLEKFNDGMKDLELLMREHIEGKRLSLLSGKV
ncbi:MAG: hypothetical protein ACLQG3_16480 [Terracidiphilus sp.]